MMVRQLHYHLLLEMVHISAARIILFEGTILYGLRKSVSQLLQNKKGNTIVWKKSLIRYGHLTKKYIKEKVTNGGK